MVIQRNRVYMAGVWTMVAKDPLKLNNAIDTCLISLTLTLISLTITLTLFLAKDTFFSDRKPGCFLSKENLVLDVSCMFY